jgi:hypothetical protein
MSFITVFVVLYFLFLVAIVAISLSARPIKPPRRRKP